MIRFMADAVTRKPLGDGGGAVRHGSRSRKAYADPSVVGWSPAPSSLGGGVP